MKRLFENWFGIVRYSLDWTSAGYLLKSPLVKTAALIPIFGYLIVFSSEVQSWLDLGALGTQLFISPELKLRFVYYGGVLVIGAFVIYATRCPSLIKQYKNEHELHSAPTLVSASDDIDRIIKHWVHIACSDATGSELDTNFPLFAHNYCESVLQGTDGDYDRAIGRTYGLRIGRRRPQRAMHENSRDALTQYLSSYFDRVRDETLRSEISEDDHVSARNALSIVNQMARIPRIGGSALEAAHILYRIEFLRQRYSRKISAFCVVAVSAVGLFLMVVPAIETLIQIVAIDAGVWSHTRS